MFRSAFTLFLLFLNVLWIGFFEYKHFHSNEMPSAMESLPIQQHLLDAQKIELQIENRPLLQIEKTSQEEKASSEWKVTTPFAWEANPLTIDQVFQAILSIQIKSTIKINTFTDFGAYGLTTPIGTFQILSTQGTTHKLLLGKGKQNTANVYAWEQNSKKIFIIDANILDKLNLPLEAWCSPEIFSFTEIQNLSLQTHQQKISLHKEGKKWFLTSPFLATTEQQRVESFCQQLLHCTCEHFLTDEEIKNILPALSDPQQIISLSFNSEKKSILLKLLPIKAQPHHYILQRKEEKIFFVVSLEQVEALLHSPESFLQRTVFHLKAHKIHKITAQFPSFQTTFQAIDADTWEQTMEQDTKPMQIQKRTTAYMQSLLQKLNSLFIESFCTQQPDLTHFSQVNLEILLTSGKKKQVVLFYQADNAYIKGPDSPIFLKLAHFDSLSFLQAFTNDKTVWEWSPQEQTIQVQLRSSLHPTFETVDQKLWNTISLKHLKAAEWLEHEISYPIFSPTTYTLRITTEDKKHLTHSYELEFSERIGGNLQTGKYLGKCFRFSPEWIDFLFRMTHQKEFEKTMRTFLEK